MEREMKLIMPVLVFLHKDLERLEVPPATSAINSSSLNGPGCLAIKPRFIGHSIGLNAMRGTVIAFDTTGVRGNDG